MNLSRILVLTLFDLRHSILRIKGLMFLLPFLLYWAAIIRLLYDGGADFVVSQQGILITTFFLSPDITQQLFINNPAVVSLCFMLELTTLPLFCILAGNNQIAGDAGRSSFRFLLTRCTRTELLLSRYCSCVTLVTLSQLLLLIAMCVLSIKIDQHDTVETFTYGLKIFCILCIYSLPLIAFMSVFSSLLSGAMSSLLSGSVMFFIMLITSRWLDEDYPFIAYVLPNSLKSSLFDIYSVDIFYSLFGLVCFTLVYLCIAWLVFNKRNV